jgi:hypothetical protein
MVIFHGKLLNYLKGSQNWGDVTINKTCLQGIYLFASCPAHVYFQGPNCIHRWPNKCQRNNRRKVVLRKVGSQRKEPWNGLNRNPSTSPWGSIFAFLPKLDEKNPSPVDFSSACRSAAHSWANSYREIPDHCWCYLRQLTNSWVLVMNSNLSLAICNCVWGIRVYV